MSKIDTHTVISKLEKMVNDVESYVEEAFPYKGDICDYSQKVCILKAIGELQETIDGVVESDFEEDIEDEDDYDDYDDYDDDRGSNRYIRMIQRANANMKLNQKAKERNNKNT